MRRPGLVAPGDARGDGDRLPHDPSSPALRTSTDRGGVGVDWSERVVLT